MIWDTIFKYSAALFLASFPLTCFAGCSEKTRREEPPQREMPVQKPHFDPENPGESRAARAISQRILFQRGEEAWKIEQHDQAIELYSRAAEILPQSELAARAHLMLGEIWAKKDDHQRSLAAVKQAAVLNDKDVTILHALALAYEKARMSEKAWKAIRKALALEKHNIELTADAARLALAVGSKENALELLEKFETYRDQLIEEASGRFPDETPESEQAVEIRRLKALKKLSGVPDTLTAKAAWTMLRDPSAEVRRASALLLGSIGYKESLKHLKHSLKTEENPDVKEALLTSIKSIQKRPLTFGEETASGQ